MSGKGRFDFGAADDFADDPAMPEPRSESRRKARLGPMAAAVRDSGEAAKAVRNDKRTSQLETLELALGMKRLREADLDLRTIDLDDIEEAHLKRDRATVNREGLEELKASIRQHGLSQPIRVDAIGHGRFGFRRQVMRCG